ncbi:MAG TPA: TlpA disulfide reductase family protein [Steroidobacteraceae bacterium]
MLSTGHQRRRVLVALIALAAGVAAFVASREFLEPEKPEMPPIQPAVIPDIRPDISLADRDGKMRALSEWDGKPAVINFWATWCAPCRREIPMLNALAGDPAYTEFELIGIAIDFREDVLRYLTSTPIDYTVLIGEQDGLDAARAFGMESIGLPFTVFTDKRDRIVTVHVGELHRPQAEVILSAVRAVDAGQINLKTAQDRIRADMPKID